jgi:hypothetical protein
MTEATMFGYQSSESQETLGRKIGYRDDAKGQWNCLTSLDLSEIKNEEQLITLVKVRYSLPYERTKAEETGQDTRIFSQGKVCQFRLEWHSGGQPDTPSV